MVPGKLLERACSDMECDVRLSDYPRGTVPGLEFYSTAGELLRRFLEGEARRFNAGILMGHEG